MRPNNAAVACRLAEAPAKLGAVQLRLRQNEEGDRLLAHALAKAEDLIIRDPDNVGFGQIRILVLAYAALGDAAWAGDAQAAMAERQRRLSVARAHVDRANALLDELKPRAAGNLLRADLEWASVEVAKASASISGRLESQETR